MTVSDDANARTGAPKRAAAARAAAPVLRQPSKSRRSGVSPATQAASYAASLSDRVETLQRDRRERRVIFAEQELIDVIMRNLIEDDRVFQALIHAAVTVYDVKQQALADELRTAPSNITRWKDGASAPPLRSRPHDIWGLHRLIMREEGLDPMPFPAPPQPAPKLGVKDRAVARRMAMSADDHFGAPDAPAAKTQSRSKSTPRAPARSPTRPARSSGKGK